MTLPRGFKAAVAHRRPAYNPDPKTFVEVWNETPGVDAGIQSANRLSPAIRKPVDHETGDETIPVMPDDITLLADEAISALYGHMVAYSAWLDDITAQEEARLAEAEGFLDGLTAETSLGKTGTVSDKKAKAVTSPIIAETQRKVFSYQARAKVLRARVRSYEKMAAALSRELTRRLTPRP